MRKYQILEVRESELEDLVRQAPDLIEDGLRFIDHQTPAAGGRLDVLLVDSGNALVIAELKVVEEDGMLIQAIDYYDYVLSNLEGFARAYSMYDINTDQQPRLFLIAPSFSVRLLNRIKWIDIPVSLYTVKCIRFEDELGQVYPVYDELNPPSVAEKPETYSLDDKYKYITDPSARQLAKHAVGQIQQLDPQRVLLKPIKYSISIQCQGSLLAYVNPRRRYFTVNTYNSESEWTDYRIDSEEDWQACEPIVRAAFDRMFGRATR